MPRLVALINGPNLNLLGNREPTIYGTQTLADIVAATTSHAQSLALSLRAFHSNHEGALIDAVHQARNDACAIVINPGGYAHTSIALRDALAACDGVLVVEVHLSATAQREAFRHASYVSQVADGVITGLGADGYLLAIDAIARRLARHPAYPKEEPSQ